jgi:WD40 repeat protein
MDLRFADRAKTLESRLLRRLSPATKNIPAGSTSTFKSLPSRHAIVGCVSLTFSPAAVLQGHRRFLQSAAFSSDGSRIVTASHDETARIWDSATAQEIAILRGHSRYFQSAAFSPDGSRVVAALVEKTAHIWDAASAKEIAVLRAHASEVKFAAFSVDGLRIVTESSDKTAGIWDAATAKEISILREPRRYRVFQPRSAPTGRAW